MAHRRINHPRSHGGADLSLVYGSRFDHAERTAVTPTGRSRRVDFYAGATLLGTELRAVRTIAVDQPDCGQLLASPLSPTITAACTLTSSYPHLST